MTPTEPTQPYIPLPAGLDNPRESARTVFDRMATVYDAARPGYPSDAITDVQTRCNLSATSRVLEIGCGTGQATRDIAQTGCVIRCLEPGPQLAAIAQRNLASYTNVEVVVSTFEASEDELGFYDAVVSATAFHWIDPSLGFPKAAGLLRPHGNLALLSNMHASGGTQDELAPAIQALHRNLAPDVGSWTFPSVDAIRTRAGAGGDIAAVWSRNERKFADPPAVDDLFERPAVSVYPWVATYDRDGYLAMLSTQSIYALMDSERRDELLHGVGEQIEKVLGGVVTKQYVTILATAERSSRASAEYL